MENLIIAGKITATSSKVDGKYQQETPTKTAYIEVSDADIKKQLTEFGLTEYTSKDDKTNFYIIKLPKQVALIKGNEMRKISGGVETPNFRTLEGKQFRMNIIKGNNKGNDFFRLQAIEVNEYDDIEQILMENPFGNGYLKEEQKQTNEYEEYGF